MTNFHQLCLAAMAMDSLPLPGSAKDLNSGRDSGWAFPQRSADLSCFDQAVSVRRRDSVTGKAARPAYRVSLSSSDRFDSRDSVPGFADSVVVDYSSPAVDLGFAAAAAAAAVVVVVVVVVAVSLGKVQPSAASRDRLETSRVL